MIFRLTETGNEEAEMTIVSSVMGSRKVRAAFLVLVLLLLAAFVVVLSATAREAGAAAAARRASVPSPVSASLVTRPSGALPRGRVVPSSALGLRVFPDAKHGFALADRAGAQYPAATHDGGTTWRIDGPPLHVNAAQAPLVVTQVGAANRKTYFAWGGPGGGQSVDVTSDAGLHWYRALLGDQVTAVVTAPGGRLVAFAQTAPASSGGAAGTWVYVSRNGGRSWHLSSSLGGL
jgi:hypothetical protein